MASLRASRQRVDPIATTVVTVPKTTGLTKQGVMELSDGTSDLYAPMCMCAETSLKERPGVTRRSKKVAGFAFCFIQYDNKSLFALETLLM